MQIYSDKPCLTDSDDWKRVVSLQFAFRLTAASYAIFCVFVYVLNSYRVGSFSQTSHSAFVRRYLMQVSGRTLDMEHLRLRWPAQSFWRLVTRLAACG